MRHQTELSYVWFLNASTAINSTKIPSCCTMYVSKAFVMERLCCTTHRPPSQCVVVPCSYTSLCVNREEYTTPRYWSVARCCLSVSFRRTCLGFFFRNGKLRKGKCWETLVFMNIHWCWWNRNCKYKYKHHAYSIKNSFFFFFFFTARRCAQQPK